ncbi:ASCH domain-containing protein [Tamaricihabitans halophyticus]|uniref:ASCH domain-containing protein n=1 Tax=Tamaricihabitans halophyticus TaxID=1262583 RepID=A0A4R2PUB4_9PSEU|nr:ASCH domain-containing protein [Tamaricihabitans halophyticus]TCP38764.1 ASCH domain-containing protein [Tamaricihabitans halophyticus]
MRALSIRQPWAALILAGHKPTENRTWHTTYRGPLAIHAGQRYDRNARHLAAEFGITTTPRGWLGTVELIDVHHDRDCCRPWGEPDTWHWVMTNPQPFAAPIPGRGQLGLHQPPAHIAHHQRTHTQQLTDSLIPLFDLTANPDT